MPPEISVAVCTFNRAGLLRKCLQGLARQTLNSDRMEVIVVDNNSSDDTALAVKRFSKRLANIKYVFEGAQGLSRARNRAIDETAAPIIAYIDDDAIPYPDWAEKLLDAFGSFPDYSVIGGESEPIFETSRPDWLDDDLLKSYSCGLNYSDDYHEIRGNEWLVECNLAYRIEPLKEAGRFSERLGRNGNLLLSGDGAVNDVIAHKGGKLLYTPFAKVRHLVPASRLTPKWIAQRRFWGGVSAGVVEDYLREGTGQSDPWKDLFLPSKIHDWEGIVNLAPDDHFKSHLSRLHNIGYLLAKMGMIAP
jgi:glycosyltransferase involved in cell wall biosynthesis